MGGPSGRSFGLGNLSIGNHGPIDLEGINKLAQEQAAEKEKQRLATIDTNRARFQEDPASLAPLEVREIVLQDLTRERIAQQEARLAAAAAPAPAAAPASAPERVAVDRGLAERGAREPTLQGRRTGRRRPGATSIGNGSSLLGD